MPDSDALRPTFVPGVLAAGIALVLWAGAAASEPIVDPTGAALARFHESLVPVSKGAPTLSRIMQFGDSHTACDLWTGALRRELQARFGDGGHGFVIPGRPWAQYRHLDVIHGYNDGMWEVTRLRPGQSEPVALGLGGVALDARTNNARVRVGTDKRGPVGGEVELFDIFYLQQPKGGQLRMRIDGKQVLLMSTKMPERGPGFRQLEVPAGPHRLELDAVAPGRVRLFGVVLERRGPGVVVDSVGLPGLRAETLLLNDADLLAAHLERRNPALLVFAFGAVEANHPGFEPEGYAEKVTKVIAHAKGGAPFASCLVLSPVDRARRVRGGGWQSPPVLADIVAELRQAALDSGCAFWDTRAAMGGEGSIHQWYVEKLALRDHIHLNRAGYEKLGGLLAEALIESFTAAHPQVEEEEAAPE